MNFFDYIQNESFFKPLVSKYCRVYYDCIQIVIDKSKELPVLYESDAKDCITIYLKNIEIQRLSQNVSEGEEEGGIDLQAPVILNLFRECGWLAPREIGRNGEYIVNITADCRRIMDFLRKLTERSGEGMMSNRIFSMHGIMKEAFDEGAGRMERPYTNILVPMMDNEQELKNELADLKDSISSIMKAVIAFQDINSFGQYIMKDEMLDKFFSEYFFVKNNGLIPTQISFIKSKLRELRRSNLYEKMVCECAEKFSMPVDVAEERVNGYFSELLYFFGTEYEENMDLIDRRINNYYNLANTRIMLMSSNGVRLETILSDFLNALSALPEEKKTMALEKVTDCVLIQQQKYIGVKSFEKNRREKGEGEYMDLSLREMSEEERRAKTEELFRSAPNRYSVKRVSNFLDTQLDADEKIEMKEQNLNTKEAALMYAASMLYARNPEFPYVVDVKEDTVVTEIADISNLTIRKR